MQRLILPSIFMGTIAGLLFGVLLLIPLIAPFILFFSFHIIGIIVIIILKKTTYAGILSLHDGCLIGAVSGFCSFVAGSVLYLPVAYLINKFFNGYLGLFSLSRSLSVTGYEVLVVAMLVFFTALLSALFNAFSGMITAYVFEKIENKHLNFQEHLDIQDIDDNY